MAIYNGKQMNLKITMYKVVFQTVEINHIFSRRKFQYYYRYLQQKNKIIRYRHPLCETRRVVINNPKGCSGHVVDFFFSLLQVLRAHPQQIT